VKITTKDKEGNILKIYEVSNPIQVSVIASKYDFWEWN
jgi:hypothetical protein